jgi:phosphatidylserine/phosphatidylglycerophosphate/cardiolipin synthase-like enzyme
MVRLPSVVVLLLAGCGDAATSDAPRSDVAGDAEGADVLDAAHDAAVEGARCEAALVEVGEGFAEVIVAGVCNRVTLTVRDPAGEGCPVASTHALPVTPGRHVAVGAFPREVVVALEAEGGGDHATVVAFGPCPPEPDCVAAPTEREPSCAPARNASGSVSLCGDSWLDVRRPTPGEPNDCACELSCEDAAPACMTGACVDGRCAFSAALDGAACDDHDRCTDGERCRDGACVGAPRTCPDAGPCASLATCDPKTGLCGAVSACGEDATCGPSGCVCREGYAGDGVTCEDLDECASPEACPEGARCVNRDGGFSCLCPDGETLEGGRCVPARCSCPWDEGGACVAERGRLRLTLHDLWGRPLAGGDLDVRHVARDGSVTAVASAAPSRRETSLELPLCAPTSLSVVAAADDHHAFALTVRWDGQRAMVEAPETADAGWALGEDPRGPTVAIGLAHRWFAAHGPAPKDGNRLELLMDHAAAWGALRADLGVARESVTGTSWWWDSDHELVRDASRPDVPASVRWDDTVLGALEGLEGVARRVLMNQFVSQDGLLSDVNVDDRLLAHAARPLDDFEYLGQANTSAGRFTVAPPSVDFRARVVAGGWLDGDVEGGAASPFSAPIAVDMRALPLGLSLFELGLASWHQKFWTVDNAIAYVGGMNAQKAEWDDVDHLVHDPRRMDFEATVDARREVSRKARLPDFEPYKDYMLRLDGPLVGDVVGLFHRRWEALRAEGVDYADRATEPDPAPRHATHGDGVRAQLVATMPAPLSEWSILESLLRAVSQARDYILIEDQYFRAPLLYDAIVARMREVPGLRLIAVTNAVSEWTDPGCWQTALAHERFARLFPERFRVFRLRAFDAVRRDCVLCVDETDAVFRDVVIHSKLVLIDDVYLEVGSCNSNNRGLLYEGELAVAVHDRAWVRAQRARIVGNMLGAGHRGDMPSSELLAAFDAVAARNGRALEAWEDEGDDLDLDGDPIPPFMVPSGFVYPLVIRAPDRCLIEGVGADIM